MLPFKQRLALSSKLYYEFILSKKYMKNTIIYIKATTHDQVKLTSMLHQVTCSSELDRVYGET